MTDILLKDSMYKMLPMRKMVTKTLKSVYEKDYFSSSNIKEDRALIDTHLAEVQLSVLVTNTIRCRNKEVCAEASGFHFAPSNTRASDCRLSPL